jgi:hypothetical protein
MTFDDAESTDSQDKKQAVNPTVEVIQSEQTVLQNATIDVPEPDQVNSS